MRKIYTESGIFESKDTTSISLDVTVGKNTYYKSNLIKPYSQYLLVLEKDRIIVGLEDTTVFSGSLQDGVFSGSVLDDVKSVTLNY